MKPDYPNARDCKHGRLARSCEICELEKEVEELKAKLGNLQDAVCGKCGRSLAPDGDCHGCRADRLEATLLGVRERHTATLDDVRAMLDGKGGDK